MVHQSISNSSKVADELYIKRVLLALEDFLFFSLYSFSGIAKQVTTLKQLRFLSCPDFHETNLEPLVLFSDIIFELSISPTLDHVRYPAMRNLLFCCSQYLSHFVGKCASGNRYLSSDILQLLLLIMLQ
jgi:hypothetical protein